MRVALDIDDTLGDFYAHYREFFKADKNPKVMDNIEITRNVYKLRTNKEFWLSIPLLETIDFIPEVYCTKRINPKSWSKEWLLANGFPNRPIYQLYHQKANKATVLKGRCDVLIDDSVHNVLTCIQSGFPALLIDRPHNQWFGPQFRIYSLCIDEIEEAYNLLLEYQ